MPRASARNVGLHHSSDIWMCVGVCVCWLSSSSLSMKVAHDLLSNRLKKCFSHSLLYFTFALCKIIHFPYLMCQFQCLTVIWTREKKANHNFLRDTHIHTFLFTLADYSMMQNWWHNILPMNINKTTLIRFNFQLD